MLLITGSPNLANFEKLYQGINIAAMRYSRNSIAYSRLASHLVRARKEKGLSLEQLADKLGVHFSIVGKIEKCRRKLDTLEFIVYCQALDINPAELIQELEQFLETHKSEQPQLNSKSKT